MWNHAAEFSWIRSQLYKECLEEFPNARIQDIEIMEKFLLPKKDETILEVWAGSGFFSGRIADRCKMLYVSDPSKEQLEAVKELWKKNIMVLEWGAEEINLPENSIDAIWSLGALHHCFNKARSFENFQKALKKWWRLVIVDVMAGSALAKHFDDKVAKYCITWHEVSFWTKEYFESLCYTSWLTNNKTIDLDVKRKFKQKSDIGKFLYKIHAMTKTTEEDCLKGAEEILGVEEKDWTYYLNRPITLLYAEKAL